MEAVDGSAAGNEQPGLNPAPVESFSEAASVGWARAVEFQPGGRKRRGSSVVDRTVRRFRAAAVWPLMLTQVGWDAGNIWRIGASSIALSGLGQGRRVWTAVVTGACIVFAAVMLLVMAAIVVALRLAWVGVVILCLIMLAAIAGAAYQLTSAPNVLRQRAVTRFARELSRSGLGPVIRVHSLVNARRGDGSAGVLWHYLRSRRWEPGTVAIAAPANEALRGLYLRAGAVEVDAQPFLVRWDAL